MKKALLGSSALVGAVSMVSVAANAAEAPTWKLTGNANFQFYWVDQDYAVVDTSETDHIYAATASLFNFHAYVWSRSAPDPQDHDWYFGVDEAELQLNVSGTADNGLNYGFKIEINANTTDTKVADEVRLQLSGGWGTVQMGDEDGAEDIMNYGGENLMGATGGFDGDQDDYIVRAGTITDMQINGTTHPGVGYNAAAPSYPTIAGDTSDATKISYFSPRFSGFQVGASLTPTPNNGDNFKADGDWENHIGVGANYDNSFGDLRIRASAVYSAASSTAPAGSNEAVEDVSAWSVGGIVGWGPFSLGANYTDNGDSGFPTVYVGQIETSYWDVAAGFETGPMYFSAGYFSSITEMQAGVESTYDHIALTADYTVAPGLSVYAEINLISDEILSNTRASDLDSYHSLTNDTTSLVMGANISF